MNVKSITMKFTQYNNNIQTQGLFVLFEIVINALSFKYSST